MDVILIAIWFATVAYGAGKVPTHPRQSQSRLSATSGKAWPKPTRRKA